MADREYYGHRFRWGCWCEEVCLSVKTLLAVFALFPALIAVMFVWHYWWTEAQPYADRSLTWRQACRALAADGRRREAERRERFTAELAAGGSGRESYLRAELARLDDGSWFGGWTQRRGRIVENRHGSSCDGYFLIQLSE